MLLVFIYSFFFWRTTWRSSSFEILVAGLKKRTARFLAHKSDSVLRARGMLNGCALSFLTRCCMLFLRFTSSIAVDVQPCSGAAAKRYHCGLSNLRCRRVTRHVTGRYGCNGTNNCALTSRTSSCSTDLVLVPPEEVPDSTYLAHKPRHGLDLCRDGWHGKNLEISAEAHGCRQFPYGYFYG